MTTNLPAIYSFPPLYTCQPNALIREQQLTVWCEIIVEFAKKERVWCITAEGTPAKDGGDKQSVFRNDVIQRSVKSTFIEEIWHKMIETEKALRIDSDSNYFILWRSLDSWSALILQWFESSGKLNQVITLYELIEGDETLGCEFHGMDSMLMEKCLLRLRERGRASLLKDQNKVMGVKVV
ncbi:LAMI_0B04324g1_1 [Lachancea mirantina]|uniref:LAMI_0B04324g1_1 n=1 Tax=Lachancea mirantina TaxID=1230905 RepID=A0A1G4IVY9_9SACH|nr:LAMI_0B04324g1_1 [Lachancea mirantina]